MKKKRESALSRSQSELCAGMDKFLTGEIERKRAEDRRRRFEEPEEDEQKAEDARAFDADGNNQPL